MHMYFLIEKLLTNKISFKNHNIHRFTFVLLKAFSNFEYVEIYTTYGVKFLFV
jgi:hypothetical protein